MEVYCRCKKCNSLLSIKYDGNVFRCPSCNEIVLEENDIRTKDYVCYKNGNLNVIGDEIDEFIANTDSEMLDKLFEYLMKLER